MIEPGPLELPSPYLLFLADVATSNRAKTAHGVKQWAPERCLGQLRLPGCAADTGLPDLTPAAAHARGARGMVIGVAPQGGDIPPHWIPSLCAALEAGLHLISGMHRRLRELPELNRLATHKALALIDVRHSDRDFPSANGRRRSGWRCLTVGLDSALGKKYAALAIERELRARGEKATFRATGQTGMIIAGGGIAIDAVTADFIAGAAETLTPDNETDHWDIIEGQGSIFHAAYAGVTLGLLHGSQPDAMVLCGHATRSHLELIPHIPHRSYPAAIVDYESLARVTNPAARVVGISVNTSELSSDQVAERHLAHIEDETGLPAMDPIRFSATPIVDALLKLTAPS